MRESSRQIVRHIFSCPPFLLRLLIILWIYTTCTTRATLLVKSAFFPFNQNDVTCHFPHNFQKELIWLYMEKRLTTINSTKCVRMHWYAMFQVQKNRAGWVRKLASVSNINVFQSSIPKMQVSFIALEHECVRYRLQKTGFCWLLLRLRSSMLVVCWQWLMGKYSLSMHNHYEPWQQPSRN